MPTTLELICPAGHVASGVRPTALLIEVLEEAHAGDGAAAAAQWVCLVCRDLVSTRLGWTTLTLLTSVGAHLLEDLDPVEEASVQLPPPSHTWHPQRRPS
jgi:hypothetical protein